MRSPRVVRSLSLLIAVVALGLPAVEAVAQRGGPSAISNEIVRSTRPLDASQRREVEDFARSKVAALSDGDPSEVVSARDALIAPANDDLNATAVFLRAYAEAILPAITPTIDGKDNLRAENALRIVAFLRTPEAAGLVVETLDPSRTRDAGRRLVAAGLVPTVVKDVKQSAISSAVLVSMARGISEGVSIETDWLVTLDELRALNAIALSPKLTKENRAQVRNMQFNAFAELSRRIESSAEPSPLVLAVHRAILSLRERLDNSGLASDMTPEAIARSLKDMLINVAGAAIRQWDGLQDDQPLLEAYAGTLKVGNQLLIYLDDRASRETSGLAAPLDAALKAKPGSPERRQAKAALEAALEKAL